MAEATTAAMRHDGRPLVLIADQDERARGALANLLESDGFRAHGVASGEETVAAVRGEQPSVVVLEVPLAGLSGYEVCRALRDEFGPELPIIFVSAGRTEPYDRVAGLLLGADDYIVKPYAPDELLARVRRLVSRSPRISWAVASKLTKRELEVLRLLAEGLNQDEIGARLFISTKTVATHIEHTLAKLDVRSRTQAVALAYRGDLLEAVSPRRRARNRR